MDSIELLIEIDLKVNENYIISEVIGKNIFLVRDEEAQNKEYHYLSLYIDPTAPAQEIKINGWVINGKSRDPISIAYEFKSRIKNLHEFIGLNERDMV